MNIKLLPTAKVSVSSEMEALYLESFPPEERRPWQQILSLTESGPRFIFLTIITDDKPAGFMTVWNLGMVVYVEHFATFPALRGHGIGREAIRTLIESSSVPVILEVEPAATGPMAARRIEFYTRAGLIPHNNFPYIQPPYSPDLPSVPLTLMTSRPVTETDLARAATLIQRHVYKH